MAEEPLRANLAQQGQLFNRRHLLIGIVVAVVVSVAITCIFTYCEDQPQQEVMVTSCQDQPLDMVTYQPQPEDIANFIDEGFMLVNEVFVKPVTELKWSSTNFPPLPVKMYKAQAVYINGTICFGGGKASDGKQASIDEYYVYCYDKTKIKWVRLGGELPVRYFGLGKVNGKIIAVGGVDKNDEQSSKTYIHNNFSWIQSSKLSMYLPRHFPGVSSSRSCVIIVGGHKKKEDSKTIEIYRSDIDQWLLAELPVPCTAASTATHGDTIFIVCNQRQPLYASVSAVINEGVPRFDKPISGSSVWKVLQETPSYNPIPAILLGNLYVLGGRTKSDKGTIQNKVYSMYIKMKNFMSLLDNKLDLGVGNYALPWVYVGDLPEPLTDSCVVTSHLSIMLLGGKSNEIGRTDNVYVGQLNMINFGALQEETADNLILEQL